HRVDGTGEHGQLRRAGDADRRVERTAADTAHLVRQRVDGYRHPAADEERGGDRADDGEGGDGEEQLGQAGANGVEMAGRPVGLALEAGGERAETGPQLVELRLGGAVGDRVCGLLGAARPTE